MVKESKCKISMISFINEPKVAKPCWNRLSRTVDGFVIDPRTRSETPSRLWKLLATQKPFGMFSITENICFVFVMYCPCLLFIVFLFGF